jgi:hypothetical protein
MEHHLQVVALVGLVGVGVRVVGNQRLGDSAKSQNALSKTVLVGELLIKATRQRYRCSDR